MDQKTKPCKGTGKAIGSGCGVKVVQIARVYGLGKECGCYVKWLLTTTEGKAKLERHTLKSKGSAQKQQSCDWNKRRTKMNIELMSADGYRAKYIQPLINHIARLIDKDQPCIASQFTTGKMSGGHYHSVGSNLTLALNLHNVHLQSYQSNGPQGGQHIKYRHGLIDVYGQDYANFVDLTLNQCPPIKLTKPEMVELKSPLEQIRNELKKLNRVYDASERIVLRDNLNEVINVYPPKYSLFLLKKS